MPRKKTDGLPRAAARQERPPFAARYIRVCLSEVHRLILVSDDRGAQKVESEIEEFVAVTFRGEAAATVRETVRWVRELAEQFASVQVEPYTTFNPNFDHGENETVIDHDPNPYTPPTGGSGG